MVSSSVVRLPLNVQVGPSEDLPTKSFLPMDLLSNNRDTSRWLKMAASFTAVMPSYGQKITYEILIYLSYIIILIFYNISQSSSSQCKSATAPGIPVSHPQSPFGTIKCFRMQWFGPFATVLICCVDIRFGIQEVGHLRSKTRVDFLAPPNSPKKLLRNIKTNKAIINRTNLHKLDGLTIFLYLLFYKKQSHQVQVIRDESMNPLKYKLNVL